MAVGDPIPIGELVQSTIDTLDVRRKVLPDDPTTNAVTPGFAPRGGLGVFVQDGTASFQDVTVEPLD